MYAGVDFLLRTCEMYVRPLVPYVYPLREMTDMLIIKAIVPT